MRDRCARHVPSVWTIARPLNAASSASRDPAPARDAGELDDRRDALLARHEVDQRAAEQRGVAQAGREVGPCVLAQAPGDRRPGVPDLAGEPLAGAGDEPRPVAGAQRRARHPRRRQRRVVLGDDELDVQRGRRQREHLARALDVRRALGELARRERVQRAAAGPAGDVAACRRRREAAHDRQERLGEVELGAAGVQDDHHLVGQRAEHRPRRSRMSSSRSRTPLTSRWSRSSWRATKFCDALSIQADIARPSFATAAGGPAPRPPAGRSGGSASRSSAA